MPQAYGHSGNGLLDGIISLLGTNQICLHLQKTSHIEHQNWRNLKEKASMMWLYRQHGRLFPSYTVQMQLTSLVVQH